LELALGPREQEFAYDHDLPGDSLYSVYRFTLSSFRPPRVATAAAASVVVAEAATPHR